VFNLLPQKKNCFISGSVLACLFVVLFMFSVVCIFTHLLFQADMTMMFETYYFE